MSIEVWKDQVEKSLISETKKLEKERKEIIRAVQEVQYLINRDIRDQTKQRADIVKCAVLVWALQRKKTHLELHIL